MIFNIIFTLHYLVCTFICTTNYCETPFCATARYKHYRYLSIFTARCYTERGIATASRLSVRDVEVSCSHSSIENYFTAS